MTWVTVGIAGGGETGEGEKYKHGWTEEQRTKNKERYGYLADASWKAEMSNTTNNCIFQSHMSQNQETPDFRDESVVDWRLLFALDRSCNSHSEASIMNDEFD